ncbi:DUF4249 domain-containing protein [Lunatibacter salilacus]|uniref:DUF4249 domain-containing protein n=1 Tax=Lunatibacter salilacus TaxID=2483804 RepID=UPI00131B522E|nr:DUF4249 domain-containing protein [Lunatibacter salilacus]
MKIQIPLVYFFSIIALSSCEQFLEVELPGQEPRMALNALLDPSDTLKVFLTRSKGVLEDRDFNVEFDLVEGAEVYLKDPDGQIFPMGYINRSRPYEPNAFYFLSGHEFREDQNYEIVAEHPQYPTISTEQKLPNRIQIKSINVVNLGPRADSESEFEVTVKFEDPPGRNFYEVSGSVLAYDSAGMYYLQSQLNPEPVNPAYKKDYLMRNVIVFDDILLNGSESEIVFRTSLWRDYDKELTIKLSHVSESYYRYYDTADLQRSSRGDFLSQPVLVYNNVTNGLGIFKARNTDQRVVVVRVDD